LSSWDDCCSCSSTASHYAECGSQYRQWPAGRTSTMSTGAMRQIASPLKSFERYAQLTKGRNYDVGGLHSCHMPVQLIRTLHRPLRGRVLISCLMSMGLLATGIAAYKIPLSREVNNSNHIPAKQSSCPSGTSLRSSLVSSQHACLASRPKWSISFTDSESSSAACAGLPLPPLRRRHPAAHPASLQTAMSQRRRIQIDTAVMLASSVLPQILKGRLRWNSLSRARPKLRRSSLGTRMYEHIWRLWAVIEHLVSMSEQFGTCTAYKSDSTWDWRWGKCMLVYLYV
jgi:hypothetical protein